MTSTKRDCKKCSKCKGNRCKNRIKKDKRYIEILEIRNDFFKKNQIVIKNSHYYLNLYQREMTWLNVVDIGEDLNFDFLVEYGNFRKNIVDKIIKLASDYTCLQCVVNAVGSVNPTSDYDITASGNRSAQLVQLFNSMFRYLFLNESGIIFDTNLYGVGFFEPTDEYINNNIFKTVSYIDKDDKTRNVIFIYIPEDEKQPEQRSYAFVKLLIHLEEGEFDYFYSLLNSKFQIQIDNAVLLRKRLDIGFDRENEKEANEFYVRELYVVQKLKQTLIRWNQSHCIKGLDEMKNRYQSAISKANYYGNETYFTRGAFFQIVGEQQIGVDLPITYDEYINSYIENAGDTLKSFSLAKQILCDQGDPIECFETVIEMSKYYYRTMDGLYEIAIRTPLSQEEIDEIKEARDLANEVRTKLRGKNICPPEVLGCIPLEEAEKILNEFINDIGFNCDTFRLDFLSELAKNLLLTN